MLSFGEPTALVDSLYALRSTLWTILAIPNATIVIVFGSVYFGVIISEVCGRTNALIYMQVQLSISLAV